MSSTPPLSLLRVPTLTEIVALADVPTGVGSRLSAAVGPGGPPASAGTAVSEPAPPLAAPDPARLVESVLRELEPRIGALIDQRLREALAPALARVAESLVAQSRVALEAAVRDVVVQAVAAAIEHRAGQPPAAEPR